MAMFDIVTESLNEKSKIKTKTALKTAPPPTPPALATEEIKNITINPRSYTLLIVVKLELMQKLFIH